MGMQKRSTGRTVITVRTGLYYKVSSRITNPSQVDVAARPCSISGNDQSRTIMLPASIVTGSLQVTIYCRSSPVDWSQPEFSYQLYPTQLNLSLLHCEVQAYSRLQLNLKQSKVREVTRQCDSCLIALDMFIGSQETVTSSSRQVLVAELSQRERAAGWVIFQPKVEDNTLQTIQVYLQSL